MTSLSSAQALLAALTADEMYFGEDIDEGWLGDQLIWKKGERHVIPIGTDEELAAATETSPRLWAPATLQGAGGGGGSGPLLSTSFQIRIADIAERSRIQFIGGHFSTDSSDALPIYCWVGVSVDESALELEGLLRFSVDSSTGVVTPWTSGRIYYRLHDMNIPPGSFFSIVGRAGTDDNPVYVARYSGSVGESSKLVFDNAFNYDTYETRHGLVGDFIWIIPEAYTTDTSSTQPIYINAIPNAFVNDIIGWTLESFRYSITGGVARSDSDGVYRAAHGVTLNPGTVLLCRVQGGLLTAEIVGRLDTPQADWNADPGIDYAGIQNKPPNSTGILDFVGNDGQIHRIFNGNHIRAAINEYAAVADWNATVSTDPARILNKPATMGDVATASASLGELGQYRVILRPETTGVPLPGPRQRVEQALWFRLSDLVSEIQSAEGTNIKSDWDAAAGTNAEILNKPTIPAGINQITMSGGITFNYDQITGNVTISGTAVGSSLERRVQALENA